MIRPAHTDVRNPALRIQLFAQAAPVTQRTLFTSPAVEPRTEPPCDHPEGGWQRDIFSNVRYLCTFCGAQLPCDDDGCEVCPTGSRCYNEAQL